MMKNPKELLSGDKVKVLVISLLLVGCVLICLPKSDKPEESASAQASDELRDYAALLEEGLARTVGKVLGEENVQVFVTLESTYENVYASDASVNETTNGENCDRKSEKQLVLTGSGTNGQQAVTVKRLSPKVKGAVIVCADGNSREVQKRITELATTALNVPSTKIYVTGGTEYGKQAQE